MTCTVRVRVNGERHDGPANASVTLAELLREELGLTSVKTACGLGECGACTVLVDGCPVLACVTLAARTHGEVTTAEGLAGTGEADDLRAAFAEYGAFQCGFCTPGHVVHAAALLRRGLPQPADEQARFVREQLCGNLCRCTGYGAIVAAVCATAARRVAAARAGVSAAGCPDRYRPAGTGQRA
jgi:aerobic-type carbon monoxide dehydrogenase small subunit (CoxS/CutS family)